MKHTAHVFLAVSGHKYPDGEHTPGKNKSTNSELALNDINRSWLMCGVTLAVLPWKRDGFNTQILQ